MRSLNIGYIGNFVPSFSTENDRKWSFEKLGHKVIPFQENETNYHQLFQALEGAPNYDNKIDLLIYSHTHGWEIEGGGLQNIFSYCKRNWNIPTASVHLDRWAWLEREKDIGVEATWFTEYQFMADFSPEAVSLYRKHSLNAHYLRPGVVEKDCYMDTEALKEAGGYLYDVVFVGSKGYHPEYPYRAQLIDFLKDSYGDRFAHYGNDGEGVARGEALNRLYAVSKIVVGDSCFGGRPNYVSDRYYETRGRGGFLIHPQVEGVDHVGVQSYDHGDFMSLGEEIDHWLLEDENREAERVRGFEHVKKNETYTNRAEEMLKIIFPND